MNRTAAFGTKLAGAKGHAGEFIKYAFGRIGKAGMRNVILNIWPNQPVA
jgi:hypothetical protein